MTLSTQRPRNNDNVDNDEFSFIATGNAAHNRLAPLVPPTWIDITTLRTTLKVGTKMVNTASLPHFLWENAPRHETKSIRDYVKCYSHLPNGTDILDSKWVLARLLGNIDSKVLENHPSLAVLDTYCFRGRTGMKSFSHHVKLSTTMTATPAYLSSSNETESLAFRDLLDNKTVGGIKTLTSSDGISSCPNLWVVKDAGANGAGGVWVVGPNNINAFCNDQQFADQTSPLIEGHRYVAQKYAWPPVLYGGRKCHVRVYGLLTCDGRAWIHRRAFLHVANEKFGLDTNSWKISTQQFSNSKQAYDPCVHITNCCANSHDKKKFAGEICADLQSNEWTESSDSMVDSSIGIVPLADYAPSIHASLAVLAERAFPFLQGGQCNHGFEYLGLDFILSHDSDGKPIAYLLEVNAPPSQDTATGLQHAEDLHDEVIRDLLSLWVLPKVVGRASNQVEILGGWQCVYRQTTALMISHDYDSNHVLSSKAAILNKMRWAIFERKSARQDDTMIGASLMPNVNINKLPLVSRIRSLFPYFDTDRTCKDDTAAVSSIFFENAGGTQVPFSVVNAVSTSLCKRNRSALGASSKSAAKETLYTLLGASQGLYTMSLGPNCTTLLSTLANLYVRLGQLTESDEIIIRTENHMANVQPWLDAAKATGAIVKWWSSSRGNDHEEDAVALKTLINKQTRVVAVAHASNVLGWKRDIQRIGRLVKEYSNGNAHLVVDGVAAVPHIYANLDDASDCIDWYVVSSHKVFGPHLGAICGRRSLSFRQKLTKASLSVHDMAEMLELGTINYEACAGIQGIKDYFAALLALSTGTNDELSVCNTQVMNVKTLESCLVSNERLEPRQIKDVYAVINDAEQSLVRQLIEGLRRSKKLRIIGGSSLTTDDNSKLPIVSFVHQTLSSSAIVEACAKQGIVARNGTFLSYEQLQVEYNIPFNEGVVRFSLVHYNTAEEVSQVIRTLESMPNWF